MRYGRCRIDYTEGDAGNGYNTFSGAEAYANDITRRWGLLELLSGAYQMQGFHRLGITATTIVDFRDSNKNLFIRNNYGHVTSAFNRIEFQHASSNIQWTSINITSLSTASPGTVVVTDNPTLTWTTCVMTDMGTFSFGSNSTLDTCTFRRCLTVTANGASMLACVFAASSVAADASALSWNTAVDTDGKLDDAIFSKGANAHHAIDFGTSSPTTVTLRNIAFGTGFNSGNGNNDSTLYFARPTGTVTVNLVGCSGNISYKSAGATITFVVNPVTTQVTAKDSISGANIQNARVILTASDGTGPLPYLKSSTITRSGSTATVSCTAHGLLTNDYAVIKGANETEYNGVFQVTKIDDNSFSYTVSGTPATPATGTITTTGVALYGLTNASGVVSVSRSYTSSQPVTGYARRATVADGTLYKQQPISGTVSNTTGFSTTIQMIRDE